MKESMASLARLRDYIHRLQSIVRLPQPLWERLRVGWWALRHTLANRGIGSRPRSLHTRVVVGGRQASLVLREYHDLSVFLEVFAQRVYEHPLLPARAQTIIDLGANIGMASIWFALKYPEATIHAFEPNPYLIDRLRESVAQFGSRVIIHPVGLGKEEGSAILFVDEAHLGSSLRQRRPSQKPVQVTLLPFEQILERAGGRDNTVDIVKFDIEGGEEALFSLSPELLTRSMSYIGEIHQDLISSFYPKAIEQMWRNFVVTPILHNRLPQRFIFVAAQSHSA